jgi:ABC-type transport system involved in Fe-S cluster assembly fused permease/ATPase subunit
LFDSIQDNCGKALKQPSTDLPSANRDDWGTLKILLPFLWQHRFRIAIALAFLVLAKLANIGVPLALKQIVDALEISDLATGIVAVPLALLVGYGVLRFSTILFQELRNAVFAKAAQQATRDIALNIFSHLHTLSLRFHLDRQTGGLSRDLERGSRSITQLLNYIIFSIFPTIFEIVVVCAILFAKFDPWFSVVTIITVTIYFVYTYKVTEWRLKFRVEMNQADSVANTTAIDSLINYETVKYFGNEELEANRYDRNMSVWQKASVKNLVSLSFLNTGQGVIIGVGLTILLVMAASEVANGNMSLGDFVMVNAFMIQLYMPLNWLGSVFREIKHCLTDMDKMFSIMDIKPEVIDQPDARNLVVENANIRFDNVDFSYNPERNILRQVSFNVASGNSVAIVGPSGSGKSTIARLLFRFYDVESGSISIGDEDIRDVQSQSLRSAIGIVPQDTVLFNDTLLHNIRYGKPEASDEMVLEAARLAHLTDFIAKLPDGLQTMVGERGLKLSGGEKQRVAIARTILKNPPILILDEATSSLDSHSEQSIQQALDEISENRTTLVIAHRLSTIVNCDEILVLNNGEISEQGTHDELLELDGEYSKLWALQQKQAAEPKASAEVVTPVPENV